MTTSRKRPGTLVGDARRVIGAVHAAEGQHGVALFACGAPRSCPPGSHNTPAAVLCGAVMPQQVVDVAVRICRPSERVRIFAARRSNGAPNRFSPRIN